MGAAEEQRSRFKLKSFLPILEWLPVYQRGWFRGDVIAALTLWALLVPEAMAYAGIAGMPPETGLYAAPLALVAYAIFGSSPHLDVGPSSAVAALSFSVVVGILGASAVQSEEWVVLSIALALMVGVFLTTKPSNTGRLPLPAGVGWFRRRRRYIHCCGPVRQDIGF
jgi:MFS superfamily sulfate permease-like transporter